MVARRKVTLNLVEALVDAPVVTVDLARIGEALATIPCPRVMGNDDWAKVVNAVWCATSGSEDGFRAADEWSKGWFYYSADAMRKRWDNCAQFPPPDMDANTLFKMAGEVREAAQHKAEREQALDKIARLDDPDYEDKRADLASDLGWRTLALDEERKRRRKRGGASPTPPQPPAPTIEQLAEAAKDIIANPDVLDAFAGSIKQRLAGEANSAKLIYLCATSRLFPKPMNLAIKGLSAIGKSHLRDRVLDYIPPEDVVAFTTLTERALIYLPGDLAHKILSMAEAVGGREHELQDYLIREIVSEGRITHLVTVPGAPGELPATQVVIKEGPVMFITTTTKARLHPEIETRILSLETDDKQESG